jgi:hypothetical protein
MDVETNNDQAILFEIGISSAAYLGTILFIWGTISKSFTMEISHSGFKAAAVNESNTMHIELVVPKEKLLYFSFDNSELDSEKVVASFQTNEIQSAIPNSGKCVNIFVMFQNDYKKLHYFRSLSSSRSAISKTSTITPFIRPTVCYQVDDIPETPIVKILVSELVETLTSITKESVPVTRFEMYPDGIRIYGIHPTGVEKGVSIFGSIERSFEEDTIETSEVANRLSERLKLYQKKNEGKGFLNSKTSIKSNPQDAHIISIQTDCMRPLTRLRTACPEGSIMEIYYTPGKPVILKCMAGVFGDLIFRLRGQKGV